MEHAYPERGRIVHRVDDKEQDGSPSGGWKMSFVAHAHYRRVYHSSTS